MSRNLSKLSDDDYVVEKGKDKKGNRVWKATSRLPGREEKTPFYDVPEEYVEMHVTRPDGSVEVIQGKWDPVMDARLQLELCGQGGRW